MLKRFWAYLGSGGASGNPEAGKPSPGASPARKPKKDEPRWNLNADEAERLLRDNRQVLVIDVRTAEEYAAGHIPGATNLDFFNPRFQEKVADLDKNKSYLLHCASGHRSTRARSILGKLNFKSVYHLDGGINAWAKAGKPLTR